MRCVVPLTVQNWEAAVRTSQEVRALLPDADVNPHMERCPVAPYNTIKTSDLQALVRLIRIKEEDFRQLEADRTFQRFREVSVVIPKPGVVSA